MSRPASGTDTSGLRRRNTLKPLSDQTYYKYCKKLLEAYQELDLAEQDGHAEDVTAWQEAIAALIQRLEAAGRDVPTRAELEKPPRKRAITLPSPKEERRQEQRRETDQQIDSLLELMRSGDKEAIKEKLNELNQKDPSSSPPQTGQ